MKRRINSQTLNLCKAIPRMILNKNETNSESLQISYKDGRTVVPGKVLSGLLKCKDIVFIPAVALQDAPDMNIVIRLIRPDLEL